MMVALTFLDSACRDYPCDPTGLDTTDAISLTPARRWYCPARHRLAPTPGTSRNLTPGVSKNLGSCPQFFRNSASAFDNPSVESLVIRDGLAESVGSDSMMSMLPRAAAAS